MQFISNTQIYNEEQKQKIKQMEKQKLTTAQVNLNVNNQMAPQKNKKNPVDMIKYINQISRQQKSNQPKPPSVTISDIKKELEVKKLIEEEREIQLQKILEKPEIKEVKEGAIHALSLTHIHPIKRKIFQGRLQQSEIVNDYVNNSFLLNFFNDTNRHLKFAFAYGLNYFRTNDDYDNLILTLQQKFPQNKENMEEQLTGESEKKEESSMRSESEESASE